MIRVVFFASLRETLATETLDVDSKDIGTVRELLDALIDQQGAAWHDALTAENVLMAVNHTMVDQDSPVADNDEVAFFPPVTGG